MSTAAAAHPKKTAEQADPTVQEIASALATLKRSGAWFAVIAALFGLGNVAAWKSLPTTVDHVQQMQAATADSVRRNSARLDQLEANIRQLQQSRDFSDCYIRSQVEKTDPAACRFLDPKQRQP